MLVLHGPDAYVSEDFPKLDDFDDFCTEVASSLFTQGLESPENILRKLAASNDSLELQSLLDSMQLVLSQENIFSWSFFNKHQTLRTYLESIPSSIRLQELSSTILSGKLSCAHCASLTNARVSPKECLSSL